MLNRQFELTRLWLQDRALPQQGSVDEPEAGREREPVLLRGPDFSRKEVDDEAHQGARNDDEYPDLELMLATI